jgi:aldose sugar dehydrogenase
MKRWLLRGVAKPLKRAAESKKRWAKGASALLVGPAIFICSGVHAQAPSDPHLLDPKLGVTKVVDGLAAPTNMVFLPSSPAGTLDILVNEKRSGKVQRLLKSPGQPATKSTVLDLAVNSSGDRGLLGIALHPDFPTNPGVYLFWTESSTGADIGGNMNAVNVPLLGHHVDRYVWNSSTSILMFDHNLINLRALQKDDPTENPLPAIHVGGVLRFGQDRKLYIDVSDNGRRGWMQKSPLRAD